MRNVDLNPGQGCSLANNAKKTYNARKFYASKHLTSAHNPVRASAGFAQNDVRLKAQQICTGRSYLKALPLLAQ